MNSAKTFILVGGKGGVGTTTLAVELATAFKRRNDNVAIVDADLTGRRAMAVTLDITHALGNARFENESMTIASAYINEMRAVELVPGFDEGFVLRPSEVEELAASLSNSDVIIVDAPQPFAAAVRPFAVRATRFLVIVEPNLLGVTGAQDVVNDLERFGVPTARIEVIVNDRSGAPELPTQEIAAAVEATIIAEIPHRPDRRFDRTIDSLAATLEQRTDDGLLEGLRPSARLPLGERRAAAQGKSQGEPVPTIASRAQAQAADDQLISQIYDDLIKRIDFVAASGALSSGEKLAAFREQVGNVVRELIAKRPDIQSAEEAAHLQQDVIDEALGLGPLEGFLREPDVNEIMVNGPSKIYVERNGKIEKTGRHFNDERQLRLIIERILTPLGRRIDEASPMVDARLSDGSRVNAIIQPPSLQGPVVTIRRFGLRRLTVNDLLRLESITEPMLDFLRAAIQGKLNIVISGGAGSGKTTLLNILSSYVPEQERVITIEDAAELLLAQEHVVRLEARPPNVEGQGELTIRDLVRNALRMRPDRIVVGECRGGEALDMLQAMNTGHEGSLTTIHANSARDALARIETMALMAGLDLPVRAIRQQIASAIRLVVHTARLSDGSRKIVNISEVVGTEGDVVTMHDIVCYQQRGINAQNAVVGEFQYSGVQPEALKRFKELGIAYDVRGLSSLPLVEATW